MKKERSRLLILNYLAQFSLQRRIGHQVYSGALDLCFELDVGRVGPKIGDLVALQSAPYTKWYLSWYCGQTDDGKQHVLESIEDGELCNWSNVSFVIYDRENVAHHPEWRWTDRQHEFNGRWLRVCRDKRDAYIYLPMQVEFEGDAVTLGVRVRHGLDERRPKETFPNWRKLTKAQMLAFYDAQVEVLSKKAVA